jgi:hypothetical protein
LYDSVSISLVTHFVTSNIGKYRVYKKWRSNYLLPYRGCLNVHEKNMEKMFPTKKSIIFIIIINGSQPFHYDGRDKSETFIQKFFFFNQLVLILKQDLTVLFNVIQ